MGHDHLSRLAFRGERFSTVQSALDHDGIILRFHPSSYNPNWLSPSPQVARTSCLSMTN